MLKKKRQKIQANYNINLLSASFKFTTKVITKKINSLISLEDEQPGFKSGTCLL